MAVNKLYGDIFGCNITIRYMGKGGTIRVSLGTSFDVDGSPGPSIPAKDYALPDSLEAFRDVSTGAIGDTGAFKGTWNAWTSTAFALSARVRVENVSVPGVPPVILDQVVPGAFISLAQATQLSIVQIVPM